VTVCIFSYLLSIIYYLLINVLIKLKKIPWLAIGLLISTYSLFGKIYSQSIPNWVESFLETTAFFDLHISETILLIILKIIGFVLVLFIAFILTKPSALLNFLFGSWLTSDTKALLAILAFALAAVLIGCWLKQFIHILVLVSSAILLRFEMQRAGYRQSQRTLLLAILSLISFTIGLII